MSKPKLLQSSSSGVPWRDEVGSFHQRLLDSLFDGVYFVDTERKIMYWNQGAEHLTGYPSSEAVGRYCFDNFLAGVDGKGCALCLQGCPLAGTLADGKRREIEVFLMHRGGHRLPVSIRVGPIRNRAGRVAGAVAIFSDVTAKKWVERRAGELENLAFRDALTGLPNRRFVEFKVKQAIQELVEFGKGAGLLMIDVDRFKLVNDTYGHDAGDVVLKVVSKTLEHSFRPVDIVGRWGGEEFLVLLADLSPIALGELAERCRNLISQSAVLRGDQRIQVTASVGATLINHVDSFESAIKRADELMYKSKASGRNRTTLG